MNTITVGRLRELLAMYDPEAPIVATMENSDPMAPPLELAGLVAEARPHLKNYGRYAAVLVIRPEPVPEIVA